MATITPDGDPVIAYGSYGSVRGYGRLFAALGDADQDVRRDQRGCSRGRGNEHSYSDRVAEAYRAAMVAIAGVVSDRSR